MNEQTDGQLLRIYAESSAESAFAELVRRHLDFVYSAALRLVCDAHLAEDVTQGVFVALAKSAAGLTGYTNLCGWLHQTARNIAAQTVRTIERRRAREQEAVTMNQLLSSESNVSWEQIAPHLDAALGELDEPDRDALFLRYFKNHDLRTVGTSLGISDDAAQKRVSRALERLRSVLAKRGVTAGAGGLAIVIATNAVQAAPVGLGAVITAAAMAGAAVSASTLITATKITVTKAIAMTTLQKTLITITLATVVGAGIYEAKEAAKAQAEMLAIQQQQVPLAKQIRQLQRERDDATNRLAGMADQLARVNKNNLELMKLRNEVSMLKQSQVAVPMPKNVSVLPTQTAASKEPAPGDIGRELGLAVVRGEAGAFNKLLAESAAEHQYFKTNNVGLDDSQRSELSSKTFAPINAAFKVIEDAAVAGNQSALDTVIRAIQVPELRSLASASLGMLAGQGNDQALEMLLQPDKYGFPLSSAVADLHFAADNGNQKAINALAAVATDQSNEPLWMMTANGLAKAATAGNQVAIDSLIGMSSSTNQNVQNAVIRALKGAANQSAKATEALHAMGVQ